MKRGAVESDTGISWATGLVLLLVVVGGIYLAYSAFKGLDTANIPLTTIVTTCNAVGSVEQGKSEYCTLVSKKYTELNGRLQYVDCEFLAQEQLLDSPTPLFGSCPTSSEVRAVAFCTSLGSQRDLTRDTFVNGRPCVSDGGANPWLSKTYADATKKA